MSAEITRRRTRRVIAVSLVVPMLLALVGLWALEPNSVNSATGQPNLSAAIVNQDDIVMIPNGDTQIPIAAGRLLVGELVNSSTDGFNWTLTNQATATEGLQNGTYSAVLTIPADFSKAYLSATTDAPVQAHVDIQTDGAHSYLATVLARSMATTLTAQLSEQFTQQYIEALLGGYSELSTVIGAAATGQQQLAAGLSALTAGANALPEVGTLIADGSQELASANTDLTSGLGVLKSLSGANITALTRLGELNQQLRVQLNAHQYAEAMDTLDEIDLVSVGLGVSGVLIDGGVGVAQYVSGLIADSSQELATGASKFADGLPLLGQGLSEATTGASAIADGLSQAASALPNYTGSQAQLLAQVAANPVIANVSTTPSLPSAQSALGAIMMPIALWLGALLLSLVYRPLQRRNLLSQASNRRLVAHAAFPMVGLAAAQGVLVVLGAVVSGVNPVHHLGLFALILTASISFALLHQGLAALAPRATWLISIGLLTLQVVAAGVILPLSFAPSILQFFGEVLPLSIAMRGAQALITGGTVSAASSILGVALSGLIGLVLLSIAVGRGRSVAPPTNAR